MQRFETNKTTLAAPPTPSTAASAGEGARRWGPLLLAAIGAVAVSALVYTVHRQSMRTLVSAHGLLHSAIAERFRAGLLPDFTPENPFFAGEPLPYYWVFHYLGARIAGALHTHPLIAFELLIVAAVWVVWFAGLRIGRRVYDSSAVGLFIAFLFFTAADGLGAWILLAKLTVGGASLPADSGSFLWGIANPVLGALGLGDKFGLYQPLLVFFINITSRPVALSIALVTCLALWNWLETGRTRSWIGVCAAAFFCALISPLIGIIVGGALASALLCVAFVTQRTAADSLDGSRVWITRALRGVPALIIGVLAAAPTYYALFLHGGGGLQITLRLGVLLAVVTGCIPLIALSLFSLRHSTGRRRRYLAVVATAAVELLLAAALIQLPAGNDSNFFHAAVAILSIPAAGALAADAWSTQRRRNLFATVLMLILLPTAVLAGYAFTGRRPIGLRFDQTRLQRTDAPALASFYEWARTNTAANAVFITDPRPPIVAAGGNVPELPALSGRFLFTAQPSSYMVEPNAGAELRHRLAVQLVAGAAPNDAQLTYLRRLRRPVYVLVVKPPVDMIRRMRSSYGAASFETGAVAVFQIVGSEAID